MIATGIVRRIDELGRVVIPKEVRRAMGIKDGDPLEIFRDKDNIVLQKYSFADEVGQAADFLKSWIDDPESNAAENMTSLELDIFKRLLEMVYKKHNGEESEQGATALFLLNKCKLNYPDTLFCINIKNNALQRYFSI